MAHGGKQWIARYQSEEIERTGIASLKVGFNKVFGYYLEVSNTQQGKVPGEYIRKQTIKNAERYITPELKEYEEKVLTADEKSKELEYNLFLELREAVAAGTAEAAGNGSRARPARHSGGLGGTGPQAELLSPAAGRGAAAGDRRWAASRPGRSGGGGNLRAQRRDGGRRGGHDPLDHRAEHGGKEHLHPPGGPDHAHGSDRQLRPRAGSDDRRGRPHFRPRRRQRRAFPRPEHVHGRDDRDGAGFSTRPRRGAW